MPVLRRSDLQRNLPGLCLEVPGSVAGDYFWHKTSGSTGQPVQVLKFLPTYSLELDAYALLEWEWQEREIAKGHGFFRIGVEDVEELTIGDPLAFLGAPGPAFQMGANLHSAGELLDGLARHQPAYLFCNPVTLRLIAIEQLEDPRIVTELEQVLTVSDRVDRSLRDLVREAFGAEIIDRYSSEEFGPIALQCGFGKHLHVLNPSVHVEIVDAQGNPCPVGVPGRVLVTALHSLAMPLIRYEIGDVATFGLPCAAGVTWPVLSEIEGRQRTTIRRSDGQEVLVSLFGAEFIRLRTVLEYRVVKYLDRTVFVARVTRPLHPADVATIEDSLQRAIPDCGPVTVLETAQSLSGTSAKLQELHLIDRSIGDEPDVSTVITDTENSPKA